MTSTAFLYLRQMVLTMTVTLLLRPGSSSLETTRSGCNFMPAFLTDVGCECWNIRRPRVLCHDLGQTSLPVLPASMSPVQTLHVSGNTFGRLTAKPFKKLKSLRRLMLDGNKITDVDDSVFSGLESSLDWLDLGENELMSVPSAIRRLRQLRTLRLSNNYITSLDARCFSGLQNLEKLNLEGNKISDLAKTAFASLDHLKILDITFYPAFAFRHLPTDDIGSLETLRIYSSRVDFSRSKHIFKTLPKLTHVEFVHNHDHNVHQTVKELLENINNQDIQYLKLADDGLEFDSPKQIPTRKLASMKRLLSLDLSNNSISRVTKYSKRFLSRQTYLQRLDLHANKLVYFQPTIINTISQLRFLDLSKNNFSKLRFDRVIGSFHQELELRLGDNPWKCDCRLKWLFDLVEEYKAGNPGPLASDEVHYTLRCAQPEAHAGRLLKDISFEKEVCPSEKATPKSKSNAEALGKCLSILFSKTHVNRYNEYLQCLEGQPDA